MNRRSIRCLLGLLLVLAPALAAQAQTYNLQGFVKDVRGVGIGGVTIDLYDPVANARATAAQNFTLANGQFNALFTPANPAQTTFYVDFAPVAGTGFVAVQLKDQHFTGLTVMMPDTILPDAVQLTVNVFDTTGTVPQPSVDLDVYDATTGTKIYTPGAVTGALGDVTVDVPQGYFDLLLTPPRAGPYGATDVFGRRITTATTVNVNLPAGSNVTGTVTDSLAAPLDRVPITISDPLTGRIIATRYNTAAGAFSFFLPPGAYDFLFEPPAGLDLTSVARTGVAVPGAAMNVVLPAATALTGTVVDGAARPQYQAKFSAVDSATGLAVDTYRARVDSTGAFRFGLPPGTYDLTVTPPPGSSLLTKVIKHVAVGATTVNLGTITLTGGFAVTGRVTGGGSPVPDVNVNAYDSRTGVRVETSRDHTDYNGNFRIILPAGTYDIDFAPPAASPWNDQVKPAVAVTANLAITPDIVLTTGASVTATVVGAGAGPLSGASVRLFDATGLDMPLSHRTSCSIGTVSFIAPPGTYTLRVLPPVGTDWLPYEQAGVVIAAPTTALGTLTLQRGVVLGGYVKSSAAGNAPIDDVNVNVFQPGTAVQVLTSNDHSNYLGWFDTAVAPATYDAEFLPPYGTRYVAKRVAGIAVPAGGLTMPDTFLDEGVLVSGRTVDASTTAPVVDVGLVFTSRATGLVALTSHDRSAFDGRFEVAVTAGSYDVLAAPALGSPYAAALISNASLNADTNLGDIPLTRGFFVGGSVKNATAQPIAGVTVTAVRSGTGTGVALAYNVTDAAGIADWMVLPAGTYDLTFTPPNGSPYVAQTLTNVVVSADNDSLFAVVLQQFTVTSVTPATGTTAGGIPVQINGTGFSGGTPTVTFGGMPLTSPVIASSTSITGTLPAHPSGVVDVVVTLSSGATATLRGGFTYQSASPVVIRVTRVRAGVVPTNDVSITWTATGAPSYSVYRSLDPAVFGAGSLVRTVPAPPATLAGEIGDGLLVFYAVE